MTASFELVQALVSQFIPNGSTATGIVAAAAISHLVLRDLRRLRRGIVHPLRFVGRFLRGATAYTALIAAGWAALTLLPHHL